MIVRTLGLSAASVFAFTLVAGTAVLIATDFVGADGVKSLARAAATQPQQQPVPADRLLRQLDGVSNLTFFEKAKVEGTPYEVQTGTTYTSLDSFLAGTPERQWCYLSRQERDAILANWVDLGASAGTGAPVYASATRIPPEVATLFGMSAEELAALGPVYCRFDRAHTARVAE